MARAVDPPPTPTSRQRHPSPRPSAFHAGERDRVPPLPQQPQSFFFATPVGRDDVFLSDLVSDHRICASAAAFNRSNVVRIPASLWAARSLTPLTSGPTAVMQPASLVVPALGHPAAAGGRFNAVAPAGDRQAEGGDVPGDSLIRIGGHDRALGRPPPDPDPVLALEHCSDRRACRAGRPTDPLTPVHSGLHSPMRLRSEMRRQTASGLAAISTLTATCVSCLLSAHGPETLPSALSVADE